MKKLAVALALVVLLLGCTAPPANNTSADNEGQGTQQGTTGQGTGGQIAPSEQPPAGPGQQDGGNAAQIPAEEASAENVASDLSNVLNDLGDLREDLEK